MAMGMDLMSPCEAGGGDQAKPGEGGVTGAGLSRRLPLRHDAFASRRLARFAREEE